MLHRLLGWIEATLSLLCVLVGSGVAAYFYPIWIANRRAAAAERLRSAEGTLDTDELISRGGRCGGRSGGSTIWAGSQAQRITSISSDDVP